MLISHGRNIQDAHELFEALLETNTSIKLFFVNDDTVEQALDRMPSNLPAVSATMRIHQVVTLAPGEILSQADTNPLGRPRGARAVVCALTYDKDLFPGIILAMDETHVQVKCMHRVGSNRFFWPACEDVLWYVFDDVLELIPPPKPVTTRHMEIQKDVWARLSE
ncbi:uncharacterized protein LOC115587267 isoform X1 [Tachysurus ichikawai]